VEIKKILVPYDSSQFSDKSLDYAVELAKTFFIGKENKQPIEIVLLHIIQELPISRALFDKPMRDHSGNVVSLSQQAADIYTEMKESMEKSLNEKKDIYETTEGIKINSVILNGNPSNQVVDYADNNSVDLIVIGSKGLQGLSKFIKGLGSVSRNVSERVSCPILIVR
jgi:nucleotide-binding universal stress UspA family protein